MSNEGKELSVCTFPSINIISQPLLCLWLYAGWHEPPSTACSVDEWGGIVPVSTSDYDMVH